MNRQSIVDIPIIGIIVFLAEFTCADAARPFSCEKIITVGEIRKYAAKLDNMDVLVCLNGFVFRHAEPGKQLFFDGTDSITVEIPEYLRRQSLFSDSTRLIISGEVDNDLFEGIEIKVREIRIFVKE